MSKAKELIDWVTKAFSKEVQEKIDKALAPEGQDSIQMSDRAKSGLQAIARIAGAMKEEVKPGHLVKVLQAAGYNMDEIFGNPDGGVHRPDGDSPATLHDSTQLLHKDGFKAIPEDVLGDMKDVLKGKMDAGEKLEKGDDEEDGLDEMEKAIKSHMKGAYGEAEKAYKAHMEKLGYRKYPDAEMRMKGIAKDIKQVDVQDEAHAKGEAKPMDVSKILKSVDPKIAPALEALFKQNKEAMERAEKIQKDLDAERSDRKEKEFVEKAAKLEVGGDKAELAKILKTLDASNPELAAKLEAVLKGAGEQIAKGKLFAEHGVQAETPTGSDAWAKIEQMAEGLVKKSGEKITKAAAIEEVLATVEGKELYRQYSEAKPGLKY